MRLEEIYEKDICREVNPAVVAGDLSLETVKTEIDEYVFTEENMQGLFDILSGISNGEKKHNGIWINGHYGSGKSHILKYLYYCLDKRFQEHALDRFVGSMEGVDVMDSNLTFTRDQVRDVAEWYKQSEIDIILFNIGSNSNANADQNTTFLHVFLNQLNRFRGYNDFSLELAEYFEKYLDRHGKFQEFKKRLEEEEGYDWDLDADSLKETEFRTVLDIAKGLVPQMDADSIYDAVKNKKIPLSVTTFIREIKSYIKDKGDKYRLLFLVDEVSQFISNRHNLLLQLQGIVEDLRVECSDKVWVACTAQQDLSQILAESQFHKADEDYGKIMGRFEIKVSLKSTTPELITQRRVLSKNNSGENCLTNLYQRKSTALGLQFNGLPVGYRTFKDMQDFTDYYPFVPYQFELMSKVFDAFVSRKFVASEVQGSERSIIKVTHSVGMETKDQEVGDLISFDQFFGSMFSDNLTAIGNKAIESVNKAIEQSSNPNVDKDFAKRVANILFMLCYLDIQTKVSFPATKQNIITLLIRDVDANKQQLIDKVDDVLGFLVNENLIRIDNKNGVDVYDFYTDDEREVAIAIGSIYPDTNSIAAELKNLIESYFPIAPRYSYCTSTFSVGAEVMGLKFAQSNPVVQVSFVVDSQDTDPECFKLKNDSARLVFFMTQEYDKDKEFTEALKSYCRANKYLSENSSTSEERQQTINGFRSKYSELYNRVIVPHFREMFDKSVIISCQAIVNIGGLKGGNLYKAALEEHMKNVFNKARYVMSDSIPTDSAALRNKILRPIQPGEYSAINTLSQAEEDIDNILKRKAGVQVSVKEITDLFQRAPYGWNPICTMYEINELVRRDLYAYQYNGDKNVKTQVVASNISSDAQHFLIIPASPIPADLIQNFTDAWRTIFYGSVQSLPTTAKEIFETTQGLLDALIRNVSDLYSDIAAYRFATPVKELMEIYGEWRSKRDIVEYFNIVLEDKDKVKTLVDRQKEIKVFFDNQIGLYKDILSFIEQNVDSWQYLDASYNDTIAELSKIKDDESPMSRLSSYKQLRDLLRKAIEELKSKIREEIKREYEQADANARAMAQTYGVEYTSHVDNVIYRKQQAASISALTVNKDASDYYVEEITKIDALRKAKESAEKGVDNCNVPVKEKAASTVKIKPSAVLKNASDVERYIDEVRSQLMEHINKGENIIIP